MAVSKDKEEHKGEGLEWKVEAKAEESSDSSSDEDPDEIVRKAQQKLEKAKRKTAKRAAAIELEKEKEKERLEKLAAHMLLATPAKTGEAGAGGSDSGDAPGAGDAKKRSHMSFVVVRTEMPHETETKSVALKLFETPRNNFVKDITMAIESGNDGLFMILQEGVTYMVFDKRDSK
jgi:hypothetical protein